MISSALAMDSFDKEDLKAMQDYLAKLLYFVGKKIKAGKTKEEVVQEKSVPRGYRMAQRWD